MPSVEAADQSSAAEPAKPPSFEEALKKALIERGVKPKCPACGSIGWLQLTVGFGGLPTVNGVAQLGLLVCKKCAHVQPFAMADLGLQLQQEERRVLTPDQIRQQNKPLIVPG